jgi:hypothetical protein
LWKGTLNFKRKILPILWRLMPRSAVTNRFFALPWFLKRHGRFPHHPSSSKATLEDYVFKSMGGPWTPFHESCVDKESAKQVASGLNPKIGIARTIAVLKLTNQTTLEEVGRFLYPFVGKNLVAKPTHTSGGIVFLNQGDPRNVLKQTVGMYQLARESFFFQHYEAQYRRLPFKILVEEGLGPVPPSDFRFYCARGKTLFCQFDRDRFGDHRQALFSVPDFKHIPIRDVFALPEPLPDKPRHWAAMLETASELSRPFDFVRVDLYDLPEGVFFSEFTFTPNASAFPFSDPTFSRGVLEEVLKASARGPDDN